MIPKITTSSFLFSPQFSHDKVLVSLRKTLIITLHGVILIVNASPQVFHKALYAGARFQFSVHSFLYYRYADRNYVRE